MDLSEVISEYSKKLQSKHHAGAISLPIPSQVDLDVLNLIELFMKAAPEQQKFISSQFTNDHSDVLLGVSERLAALAVRERKSDILLKALIVLAFEDAKFDVRENILVMAPLYHSAIKIGANPKGLFHSAATYATDEELKRELYGFPDRLEEDRNLEAMEYKEIMSPDGFRYKRIS